MYADDFSSMVQTSNVECGKMNSVIDGILGRIICTPDFKEYNSTITEADLAPLKGML
jgi:hypothetical protein